MSQDYPIQHLWGVNVSGFVNLVKLCVGADAVEDLINWQADRAARIPAYIPCHVTRMWPKRADELLRGGSLYWVFKGVILARQRISALEERRGDDGIARCALVFEPPIIRTVPAPRRPFQGWRYLEPQDSPRDLPQARSLDSALPEELALALAEIGLR